ncbi:siderophore-interacting protein [Ornithinicoccus hortensis]|uniref:NADPH-dependent ferric siderophore reductase n=1 Tax=Ornithinicoccus hortensis TaxID=82346 RepID=A0A542YM15_9MICO|nr:siderophore-interacting protein [Ornithinicoccus hortensis]TQL49126.1 NADPH-dependent ferric siderophore reductase [Ornithinicoccus hortensis]
MPPQQRKPRRQTVLEVVAVERLAPHLVRIVAGGPNFADYEDNEHTDKYVKMLFADPALGLTPPYDLDALRDQLTPEQMPSRRTYTVRWVDTEAQQLAIDFVTHGDEGIAGPWAERAQVGDPVVFNGPGGGYTPDPEADWHLLAGDDAALPAIAAALEALPRDAVGSVVLEVDSTADHVELDAPEGVDVTWLHREGAVPGTTTLLADGLRAVPWREGRVHVFAHGEREAMKSLRDYLFGERELERSQVSLSGYWAYGRTEDRFQAEKREPIGQILPA